MFEKDKVKSLVIIVLLFYNRGPSPPFRGNYFMAKARLELILNFNSTLMWFFSLLKFSCVCTRPRGPQAHMYKRGVEVNVRIKKLEATERFLGFEKDLSMLESECVLLGLKEKAI